LIVALLSYVAIAAAYCRAAFTRAAVSSATAAVTRRHRRWRYSSSRVRRRRQSPPSLARIGRPDPSHPAQAATHAHRPEMMRPRKGVPATHSASQRRVNALLLARGAPRGADGIPGDDRIKT